MLSNTPMQHGSECMGNHAHAPEDCLVASAKNVRKQITAYNTVLRWMASMRLLMRSDLAR